jgi:pyruvate,orthophosphate dikinase
MAVFSSDKAAELGKGGQDQPVILCSQETTPDDLKGMLAAQGVLTSRGGRTSHAALVARQFGIPTICGCSDMKMDGHHATQFTTPDGTVIKKATGSRLTAPKASSMKARWKSRPPVRAAISAR